MHDVELFFKEILLELSFSYRIPGRLGDLKFVSMVDMCHLVYSIYHNKTINNNYIHEFDHTLISTTSRQFCVNSVCSPQACMHLMII